MKTSAIRTARAPARLARRHRLRPALERWLAEADLARLGLPAGAIVLVRRLEAAWSGLASAEPAVRYEPLREVLAGAVRPARDAGEAGAVWFADEAELLACMARDALAGTLVPRWWWRLLMGVAPGPSAVRAQWMQRVTSVPAAVARLESATAVAWFGSWTDGEQAGLLRALSSQFVLHPQVQQWVLARARARPVSSPLPGGSHAGAAAGRTGLELAAPPERMQALLRALAVDPMAALDLSRLQRALCAPAPGPLHAELGDTQRVQRPDAADTRVAITTPSANDGNNARTAAPRSGWLRGKQARPANPTHQVDSAAVDAEVASSNASSAEPRSFAAENLGPPAAAAAPYRQQTLLLPSLAGSACSTRFAGIFFLLNAALQLGLYGDFTQPQRPGLRCPPWRFLLTAGRALAGRPFARDPLAGWLRERAGTARAPWQQQCAELLAAECARLDLAVSAGAGPWPLLRARLAQALDLPDARALSRTLLRIPGEIVLAGERLDLHMPLAALPLGVRIAGLDRDPGWIPAAACDFRFHFE